MNNHTLFESTSRRLEKEITNRNDLFELKLALNTIFNLVSKYKHLDKLILETLRLTVEIAKVSNELEETDKGRLLWFVDHAALKHSQAQI